MYELRCTNRNHLFFPCTVPSRVHCGGLNSISQMAEVRDIKSLKSNLLFPNLMSDFYIEHPEELKGQPKRTIGDYVESNGILVPTRFDSLADALASGKPFIARSEHPQDYDGMSGMLRSPRSFELIGRGIKTEEELKETLFPDRIQSKTWLWHKALGVSEEQFKQQVSLSYWRFHEGINCAVVTDSAIPNRYHVMVKGFQLPVGLWYSYAMVEEDMIGPQGGNKLPENMRSELPKLLEMYETVRQLPRFDPTHCPMMEMQIADGKIYFLQYHHTRDFMPADFVLDRPPKPTEHRALFVRGTTPPNGKMYKITTAHGWIYGNHSPAEVRIPEQEEGAFWDPNEGGKFPEIMAKRRFLQVIENDPKEIFVLAASKHFARSILFKPKATMIIRGLHTVEEYDGWVYKAMETKEDQHIDVHVISDGKTAYVERA